MPATVTGTATFSSPGSYLFTVPAGVTSITVTAIGAAGGAGGGGGSGIGGGAGEGASVTASVAVVPGEQLFVGVGAPGGVGAVPGALPAAGGIGGGGAGGSPVGGLPTEGGLGGGGGGGGGASAVGAALLSSPSPGFSPPSPSPGLLPLLVVAGGGGGGGGGGAGALGPAGEPAPGGGNGGNADFGGAPAAGGGGLGGGPGTSTVGGAGAAVPPDLLAGGAGLTGPGAPGSFGLGGPGGSGGVLAGGGGGGGGGYYGGGGAGPGDIGLGGGGGGGGSSFVAAGATGVSGPTPASATAQVTITYPVPVLGQSLAAIGFAAQPQGTVSAEQTLTVTNNGSAPLVVSDVLLGGPDPGDYLIGDRCQQPVQPASSCQVGVRFAPQKQGVSSASLTLLTNAPSAPAAVALSGTGGPPAQSPAVTTPGTISQGAAGPAVSWAQYLLVIVGKTLSDKQIDGIFGPVTKSAVAQFQRTGHLAVDGIVGPARPGPRSAAATHSRRRSQRDLKARSSSSFRQR